MRTRRLQGICIASIVLGLVACSGNAVGEDTASVPTSVSGSNPDAPARNVPCPDPGAASGDECAPPETTTDNGTVDGGGETRTIVTVRNPAAAGHVALGRNVTVSGGVVTGLKTSGTTHGFYMQDPSASAWAGIYVFVGTGPVPVAKGDVVSVRGQYTTYRGLEQLATGGVPPTRTGSATVPAALVVSLDDIAPGSVRARELQSMLLRVVDVEAATGTAGVDFLVRKAGGGGPELPITSFVANDAGPSPFPVVMGRSFASIRGFGYHWGSTDENAVPKLAPESAADLE